MALKWEGRLRASFMIHQAWRSMDKPPMWPVSCREAPSFIVITVSPLKLPCEMYDRVLFGVLDVVASQSCVPTLIIILFCMQDFDGIINATYTNNWAGYLVQLVGENGAVAILSMLWYVRLPAHVARAR